MTTASGLRSAIAIALTLLASFLLAQPARANAVPRFEPTGCWSYVPPDAHARCGFLVVPESRSNPTGKTIRVAVAVVPAARKDSVPDSPGRPTNAISTGPFMRRSTTMRLLAKARG